MSFKFKPIPTIDREATEQELENIKESEKMLKGEKKLPLMSQMVRRPLEKFESLYERKACYSPPRNCTRKMG